MLKRYHSQLVWLVLLIGLLVSARCLIALYQIHQQNQLIAQLQADHDIPADKLVNSQPEVRMARAVYLRKHHHYAEALATLSLIMQQGDTLLQAKVRYNLGNIYLEQAVTNVENRAINQALPLLMLAKQAYRQALALDSGFWDAKYNLEVAMRLLPEMARLDLDENAEQQQQTQLWTTMPGFPRGLP
ncbi:MAG: MxaK protein [Methylococcaceae bacterium]|jgi:mxaK protein